MLRIDIPTLEEFKALTQIKGETCVSLYVPTSPLGTGAKFNRTAFKDREGSLGADEGSRPRQEQDCHF